MINFKFPIGTLVRRKLNIKSNQLTRKLNRNKSPRLLETGVVIKTFNKVHLRKTGPEFIPYCHIRWKKNRKLVILPQSQLEPIYFK